MVEERTVDGMKLVRVGRGLYHCFSQTQPDTFYVVDVTDNNPLGGCNCRDFVHRRLPLYEREGLVALNKFRCKHLRAVRTHVLDQILLHYEPKEQNRTCNYQQST